MKHRRVFVGPQESFLAPKFKQIVQYCQRKDATRDGLLAFLEEPAGRVTSKPFHLISRGSIILPSGAARVYRFPMFEKSFCEELLEELEHFERSSAPKGRPNTMNHYGVKDPAGLEV